ncbi:WD40 repeat domain-containing protein [Nonomuraea gerenzanensis]|uniref:WD-40 repeat protein n=1 Tax=Nonomuraea gerenzanensis TaxID=93944 RepID=A0A1M4EES3_9ACTN|nr:hypothetical protein [Nonomuraea gerenzanensis]UBU08908.1 hypothetical protein LCN96_31545 [Nonomuraea gerenzanensis]SBO97284.1 WD-40 repeat protein [Nonomuraea gerenzanensis]
MAGAALVLAAAAVLTYLGLTSSRDRSAGGGGAPFRPTTTITGLNGPLDAMTFSQGGKLLITVGHDDHQVRRWNVVTGEEMSAFTLKFSGDGTLLATSGSYYDTTRLWDVAEGRSRPNLPMESGNLVGASAFSPDGARLATVRGTDPGNRVQVWEVADGKNLGTLSSAGRTFSALGFAPDGRVLAAGAGPEAGSDGVLVRDVLNGELEAVFPGHTGPLLLTFSQDGRTLAAAGADGTVRLWPIT